MNRPDIIKALPPPLLHELEPELRDGTLCEVRLRLGRKTEIVAGNASRLCGFRATPEVLRSVMEAATGHSLYAAEPYIREGFCTTRDGCRIGLTGTVVRYEGGTLTIRDISSLNIRIAQAFPDCADGLLPELFHPPRSTLLIGPPACGKTTLLRELIRHISDVRKERIGLADVRFELAAAVSGVPTLDVGQRTDVLSGGETEESILILLRTMNPQWIAVDEITRPQDIEALLRCANCGVRLLATVHAENLSDLRKRAVFRGLLSQGIFGCAVELGENREKRILSLADA